MTQQPAPEPQKRPGRQMVRVQFAPPQTRLARITLPDSPPEPKESDDAPND